MTVETIPAVHYYYDENPTEEDLMGDSTAQFDLSLALIPVLRWLFRSEGWFITGNLNLYTTINPKEKPLAPDVAVFKGVVLSRAQRRRNRSWPLPLPGHPPPTVVFEIASDETVAKDLNEKPARYASMGVAEYYSYDPRELRAVAPRLRGWRCRDGVAYEIEPDERGWIWSKELDSWLVPDEENLRLYDPDLKRRLTGEEAKEEALEAERAAKERAWAKLRELGIEPEEL